MDLKDFNNNDNWMDKYEINEIGILHPDKGFVSIKKFPPGTKLFDVYEKPCEGNQPNSKTANCAIFDVMRCAWKWLLAAGVVSLLAMLIVAIVWLIIYGNQEHTERWIEIWLSITLSDLMIAGIAVLLTYWKDVKQWVCDKLRCA